jgi:hypothetical protein
MRQQYTYINTMGFGDVVFVRHRILFKGYRQMLSMPLGNQKTGALFWRFTLTTMRCHCQRSTASLWPSTVSHG